MASVVSYITNFQNTNKIMIKANELRIGNFIFLFTKQEIFEVVSMTKNTISSDSYCREHSEFEGIPLTEEWLLKAGCKDKNHYTLDLKAKRKLIVFNWFSKVVATGKRHGFYSKKYRHIKYVHQLQNLYFALTGVELVFSTEP